MTYSTGSVGSFVPQPVGAHIPGGGHVDFADPLADGFTGGVKISQDAVEAGRNRFGFGFNDAFGESTFVAFHAGHLYFVKGALKYVNLYADDDGRLAAISGTSKAAAGG